MARLGVLLFGDASGVKKAFKEAETATKDFAKSTDQVSAGFGRARIAGIRLRSTVGGLAPAAGALIVAAQASRELSDQLAVTGDEAFTTEGKFRNLGSELLKGNIIGGIKALAVSVDRFNLNKFLGDTEESSVSLVAFAQDARDAAAATDQAAASASKAAGRFPGTVFVRNQKDVANSMRESADQARVLAREFDNAANSSDVFSRAVQRAASNAPDLTGAAVGALSHAAETTSAIRESVASRTKTRRDDLAEARRQEAQAERIDAAFRDQTEGRLDRQKVLADARTKVAQIEQQIADDELRDTEVRENAAKRRRDEQRRARIAFQQSLSQVSGRLQLGEALAEGTPSIADNLRNGLAQLSELRSNLQKATSDGVRAQIVTAINAVKESLRQVTVTNGKLERLDKLQSARTVARDLTDSREELAKALQQGGKFGIRAARRNLEDAQLARQRLAAEGVTFRGSGTGPITINVNGAGDPEKVAQAVLRKLNERTRTDTSTPGGRTPGFRPF